jgi:hypothetical protein
MYSSSDEITLPTVGFEQRQRQRQRLPRVMSGRQLPKLCLQDAWWQWQGAGARCNPLSLVTTPPDNPATLSTLLRADPDDRMPGPRQRPGQHAGRSPFPNAIGAARGRRTLTEAQGAHRHRHRHSAQGGSSSSSLDAALRDATRPPRLPATCLCFQLAYLSTV